MSSTFIVLLLVVGPVLAMVFMHRGGAGMGGHGGHRSHRHDSEYEPVDHGQHDPVFGKRGERTPVGARDTSGKRDRHGCH